MPTGTPCSCPQGNRQPVSVAGQTGPQTRSPEPASLPGSHVELTACPPWLGSPGLGAVLRTLLMGRRQDGQGAYGGAMPRLGVALHTHCPEPQAATPPDRVRCARSQGGTVHSPAPHPGLAASQDQHPRLWAPLGSLVQPFPQVSQVPPDSHRRPCLCLWAQQDWSQWQKWPSGALRPYILRTDICPAGHHWGPQAQALRVPWLE